MFRVSIETNERTVPGVIVAVTSKPCSNFPYPGRRPSRMLRPGAGGTGRPGLAREADRTVTAKNKI